MAKADRRDIPEAERPYPIPDNWRWARIGAVADLYTGNSINEKVKKQRYEGNPEGYLYISTKDIGFDGVINYETNVRIPQGDGFKVAPPEQALRLPRFRNPLKIRVLLSPDAVL